MLFRVITRNYALYHYIYYMNKYIHILIETQYMFGLYAFNLQYINIDEL